MIPKLNYKIVVCDGEGAGRVFRFKNFIPVKDYIAFEEVGTGQEIQISSEKLEEMKQVGRIKLWRNGLERAKDIARSK